MIPISRILVPVDFSDRCLGILPFAKTIAARYDAEIILLHVFNPVYTIPAAGPFGPVIVSVPSVFEDSAKRLDVFGEDQLGDVKVRRLVYEGDPVDQIVAFAGSEDVRLIVMTTHGYGALRRFLIGSVAAKVLHDVTCPVLTGAHMDRSHPHKPVSFSNILCAVDLGPQSQQTLTWASRFASDVQARLGIVHAVTSPDSGIAGEQLEKLKNAVGAIEAATYIQEGAPVKTVCSLAESVSADLLVIGRGSQEGSAGRLRTNAYGIIRESPCAVVSV